jgi:cardiolipin synthase
VARASLTKKRLVGIDRSGGPPPETRKGQPLRPFTIPNLVSYVRLALLPVPLTDRALVLAGVIVCYEFELLPRWALIVLAARELFMLVLTQYGLRKGMDLQINMVGRWAVWPVMFAIFLTLLVDTWVADASLLLGLALTLWATAIYVRDGVRFARTPSSST